MLKNAMFLAIVFLMSTVIFATCSCGEVNSKAEYKGDQISAQGLLSQNATKGEKNIIQTSNKSIRIMARNVTELKQIIQQRQQEMVQEIQGLNEKKQNVYQNQNRVRLAVHSLLAMENLSGGIGQNISKIAREFNNSVQATIKAEEKIQTRGRFIKFFFGGDSESAEKIEKEVQQNQRRIQKLKQLKEKCSEEVKTILQEQIQNMEQEQMRLQELSQEEKKNKGLFGWLWK